MFLDWKMYVIPRSFIDTVQVQDQCLCVWSPELSHSVTTPRLMIIGVLIHYSRLYTLMLLTNLVFCSKLLILCVRCQAQSGDG